MLHQEDRNGHTQTQSSQILNRSQNKAGVDSAEPKRI